MVRAVPPNVLEQIVARIPVGRLGKPEEIARAVLFLVADEAGFITGSTLSANGGQYMDSGKREAASISPAGAQSRGCRIQALLMAHLGQSRRIGHQAKDAVLWRTGSRR